MKTARLLSGSEAVVEAALASKIGFFAGYPITPASEIMEMLAAQLPSRGGTFVQAEDELASAAMIIGASLAGVRAMTATSGPGFSLMQENIGFAVMCEVPCLIVNVQRGGPSTGLPTRSSQADVMQMRWGTHGDHSMIVFCPWSVQEAYDLTRRAVLAAEHYRTPVILALEEVIAHMRERASISSRELNDSPAMGLTVADRPSTYRPYEMATDCPVPLAVFGSGYRIHVTGLMHDEQGFPTADDAIITRRIRYLSEKIEHHAEALSLVDTYCMDDAMVAVIGYGGVARSAYSAVQQGREQGLKLGLIKLSTLWPFCRQRVRRLLAKVKAVVVAEMNLGQMSGEIERIVRGRIPVTTCNRIDGRLVTPQQLLSKLSQVCDGIHSS